METCHLVAGRAVPWWLAVVSWFCNGFLVLPALVVVTWWFSDGFLVVSEFCGGHVLSAVVVLLHFVVVLRHFVVVL